MKVWRRGLEWRGLHKLAQAMGFQKRFMLPASRG